MERQSHYGCHDWMTQGQQGQRYAMLAALYTGSWHADPRWPWGGVPQTLYRNSRQIVKMTRRIVKFYEQFVWQGALSTNGEPLPDGTRGAIPIDPQTGNQTDDDALIAAIHQNFQIWRFQPTMALIAKTAAIFGDVLVELVDDFARGVTYPNLVYPGYVPDADLELDLAGNVKRYAIEYQVQIAQSTAFGEDVAADSFRFRKEVDREAFRYYRDDAPFDYDGLGAVQPNPYGFVPAALFRFEHQLSNRGVGAYEHTALQANDLNSTLSSATDYQRRQFGAPIGVKGSVLRPGRTVTMPGGISLSMGASETEIEEARRQSAEALNLLPLSDSGDFVTIQFDVGKTMEMVSFIHDSLIAENPEAEYGKRLMEMTQVTGPGGRIILAPIYGLINGARGNLDLPMLSLCQMGVSIMGYRVNNGDIPEQVLQDRPARYDAFRPFDLDSWGQGKLDAVIATRDPFPESNAEKIQWLAPAADLPPWGLRELGVSEEDIAAMEAEKERARQEMAAALSVAGAGNEGEEGQGPSGPSGPTGVTE